jgi:hypothetical protein
VWIYSKGIYHIRRNNRYNGLLAALNCKIEGSVWDSTSNGLEIIKSRISTFSDRFDILMKIRLSGVATLAGKIKEKCQA